MDANLSACLLQQPFLFALFTDGIRVFLPNFISYLLVCDQLSSQFVHGEKLVESLSPPVTCSMPHSVYFSTHATGYFYLLLRMPLSAQFFSVLYKSTVHHLVVFILFFRPPFSLSYLQLKILSEFNACEKDK